MPPGCLALVLALALFGFGRALPQLVQRRPYTVVAVNVGGCLVPLPATLLA